MQRRCACRRHAEFGSLSYSDRLISWLCRDCRRYPYRQGGIIAGHASTAIAHNDGEEAAVIGRDRRWRGVGRVSGSRDVRAVFAPLILQRGSAGRGYLKPGCLAHIDCLIGRLSRDRRRGRCRRWCRCRCWSWRRCLGWGGSRRWRRGCWCDSRCGRWCRCWSVGRSGCLRWRFGWRGLGVSVGVGVPVAVGVGVGFGPNAMSKGYTRHEELSPRQSASEYQ